MKQKKLLRWMIIAVLCAIFLFSAGMAARYAVRSHAEQKAFDELASMVNRNMPEAPPASVVNHEALETASVSPYLSLKLQNPDFFGWISIDGTKIDYPVMYTPDDPEYYLRRAFDQSSSRSGVPFLDASCCSSCGNYLIYGHNMGNGTMFAELLSYAEPEFWQEHPRIRFDTLDCCGTYVVLSAFYTEIYPESEPGFRYYQYTDLREAADFDAYMDQVKAAALYETGVTAEYGDQLLTLSTCSYHTENGRFVVVARKETASKSCVSE